MAVIFEAITPDTLPTANECRALLIPDDPQWVSAVTGALELLTLPGAWESAGGQTPGDTAAFWVDFFDKYCFKVVECRMIGEVIAYAGSGSPPLNWLDCDGSSLVRADYPDLFTVLGVVYGSVDSSHFSLPDVRGRVLVGFGTGTGLTPYNLGDVGGEETHTITTAESAAHAHSDTGHTHTEGIAIPSIGAAVVGVPVPSSIPGIGATGIGFAGISSSGGNGAHNNIQPFLALRYLIRALP